MTDHPPIPLFGEDWLSAVLLEIVCRHCGTTGDDLDSHGVPAHADLMRLCAEQGDIEITGERDGRIFATVTPDGRGMLDWLRADRERDRQRGAKPAKETRTGADLIAALQASPNRDIDIEPERERRGEAMTDYRLDPKNLPQLTEEEARRLDETPIDYSDIPPLGDEFFTKAAHVGPITKGTMSEDEFEEARRRGRALLRQILKDPPPPYRAKNADDPWLNAMLDDVHKRISAMIEARGDGEFSREEDLRYMRLVRELAEISTAMHQP